MPSGLCRYNSSNTAQTIHVDLTEPFTLHHDLVLVIFWTVYFIVLSSPFVVSFFQKLSAMKERLSIRRYISRAIRENEGKMMHMEILASGRVSFKPRFQVERKYKVNVMKIVNEATPPMPLDEIKKFGFELMQRSSVIDIAAKVGDFAEERLSVPSMASLKGEASGKAHHPLSGLRKATAKVHPGIPKINIIAPSTEDIRGPPQQHESDEERPSSAQSGAEDSESDMFIPIPYGIKIDRRKVDVVIRNGIEGIIVNADGVEGVSSEQHVPRTYKDIQREMDDREAARDYNFQQIGRRATVAGTFGIEEGGRRPSAAHMPGVMAGYMEIHRDSHFHC